LPGGEFFYINGNGGFRFGYSDPNLPNPNANLWFNPAAYTVPQAIGRNGDTRHNSLRGPGYDELDRSLGKTFTLAEGKILGFKGENYNVTNHVNLANPSNTNIDESGTGQITAADIMRPMQFGLHFRF
jgi:hypothetical protein